MNRLLKIAGFPNGFIRVHHESAVSLALFDDATCQIESRHPLMRFWWQSILIDFEGIVIDLVSSRIARQRIKNWLCFAER